MRNRFAAISQLTVCIGIVSLLAMAAGCGGGTPTQTQRLWTWAGGSSTVNAAGSYGTLGMPAPGNVPGAREGAIGWTDVSGNRWLFGGSTFSAAGTAAFFNDLWKFDGSNWTWVSGASTVNAAGVYGTLGIAAPGNDPGARTGAGSWMDRSGNRWLFGGYGYDSAGTPGELNDLWKFDGTNWTWVSGAKLVNAAGVYGTLGTPAASNVPGARSGAESWLDSSGNRWLFGGYGYDSAGTLGELNDLWKFDGTSWTWVSGAATANARGSYGTLGVAAPVNVPGARNGAVSWIDGSGNRWLFGGYGYDASGVLGELGDLWEFNGTSWAWVNGSSAVNASGTYGTLGVAGASNMPGARHGAIGWIDSGGNRWLFGGYGYDAAGTASYLNDLWKFDGSRWTWLNGAMLGNAAGVYGTLGIAAASNVPGARNGAVAWLDGSSKAWMFGGYGYDASGTAGHLNDLWFFQP